MDNNPDIETNISPTRRVSKRMKLATLRRTSAVSTSTQPASNLSPTTSNSATGPSTAVPTAVSASSAVPTTTGNPTLASSSLAYQVVSRMHRQQLLFSKTTLISESQNFLNLENSQLVRITSCFTFFLVFWSFNLGWNRLEVRHIITNSQIDIL
jgi:hypothetical protein